MGFLFDLLNAVPGQMIPLPPNAALRQVAQQQRLWAEMQNQPLSSVCWMPCFDALDCADRGCARASDMLNAIKPPRPEPSADDFDLWCTDSRDLTYEEWCTERYG